MRTFRSVIGIAAALLPVLYCGGLLLYFNNVRAMAGGAFDRELGPTIFGLAAFGLLFLVLLLWKLRRLMGPPAPPAGRTGPAPDAPQGDFDPDAALARYLARRDRGGEAGRTGFGRKGG